MKYMNNIYIFVYIQPYIHIHIIIENLVTHANCETIIFTYYRYVNYVFLTFSINIKKIYINRFIENYLLITAN